MFEKISPRFLEKWFLFRESLLYLHVYEALSTFSCVDWQFYLFLARHLVKFELPARTANKNCLNYIIEQELGH